MSYKFIEFEVKKNVAHIVLNRPDAANAMDINMSLELMHAAIECDENPDIRAVLLTGKGRFFCAGGDLSGFAKAGDRMPHLLKEMRTLLNGKYTQIPCMSAGRKLVLDDSFAIGTSFGA